MSGAPELRLHVIGDGPERSQLEQQPNIRLDGLLDSAAVYERMRRAAYLVMPSIWYEGFPRTLVEAFACGLPVIASRIGSLAELIRDGETGLLFDPGSSDALRRAMNWADRHPEEIARMGERARADYESRYTAVQNYITLSGIYREAVSIRRGKVHVAAGGSVRGA
jgi:glycosyltransferase involved in cell wall biosynthesis